MKAIKALLPKVKKAGGAFVGAALAGIIATVSGGGKLDAASIGASVGLGVAAALAVFGLKNAPWKTTV